MCLFVRVCVQVCMGAWVRVCGCLCPCVCACVRGCACVCVSGGASLKNGEQLCLSRCHCLSTNERETNESTNERNRFEFDSEVKSQQLDSRTVRAGTGLIF